MRRVFITGIFRSGTSLLSAALNVRDNVMIAWQPYWLFFKTCRNKFYHEVLERPIDSDFPMGILDPGVEDGKERFRDVFDLVRFDGREVAELVSRIGSYLDANEGEMNAGMKPERLSRHLGSLDAGTGREVLSQLMERLPLVARERRPQGRPERLDVVGIKEVFCEEFIEPILRSADMDFVAIQMVRDPRGVAASRNYGRYLQATGGRYPIFFIIRSWKRSVQALIRNRMTRGYRLVRYEDLVKEPHREFEEVCALLGIPFSEDVATPGRYRDAQGNRWRSNSSFGDMEGIETSSVRRWEEVLPRDVVEVIEYHCKQEMEVLGYETTTKSFDVDRIGKFREDRSSISNWLLRYGF